MGFSAEWLSLREPVDHAAVNRDLAAAVAEWFAGPDHIAIMDLGCGTGSNLRGSYHLFADSQHWTLIDHDPALLDAARAALSAWADAATEAGEELLLAKGDKRLMVDFRQVDLMADLERVLDWRPDLITAAALFDLVSAEWLARFAGALAARRLPLYTVLTYDGLERWEPEHPSDAAMLAAFNAHQHTDKGFGPAAGPDAVATLAAALREQGQTVRTAESPWRLSPATARLTRELTQGIAAAVRETGRVGEADIAAWLAAKPVATSGLVGHRDLFAHP